MRVAGRITNLLPFVAGAACMLIALGLENVTFVKQAGYASALRSALVLASVADLAFLFVGWRGTAGWRVAAILGMLPTIWIEFDFARRAPFVFH